MHAHRDHMTIFQQSSILIWRLPECQSSAVENSKRAHRDHMTIFQNSSI
jgi:hypothetical protein